jgi:co-chaperonin GroES (HSP10)
MPQRLMLHEIDPRDALRDEIGDTSKVQLLNNEVLVAVYERPERTKSGILLTAVTREEDKYQSKVGLIMEMGPSAFDSDGKWFNGPVPVKGDWIVFRASDGWSLGVNQKACRILDDIRVRAIIDHPDRVW